MNMGSKSMAGRASGPNICALIPAYCEAAAVGRVVEVIRGLSLPVLVVDDGSTDDTAHVAERAGARVVRHERNRGKGAALQTGFRTLIADGHWTGVVTLDADGQHDPAEIPKFVAAFRRTAIPVLIGNRLWDPVGMPRIRWWTNRYMSWLLSREMGQYIPDTQCGFRFFRADLLPHVEIRATRFAAESEILLHLAARGVRMDSVRIRSIYGRERSEIHPLADTIRFYRMLYEWRRRHPRRRLSA